MFHTNEEEDKPLVAEEELTEEQTEALANRETKKTEITRSKQLLNSNRVESTTFTLPKKRAENKKHKKMDQKR